MFAIGCYGEAWKPSPDRTCVGFEVDDLDVQVPLFRAKVRYDS
jgi:hypothetical protein